MDMLKEILKLTQPQLLEYCESKLLERYEKVRLLTTKDFIYAIGDIPIMLVAHLDTVHIRTPKLILHDKEQGLIWSPEGIGGDDRCGVYAILKIIETYRPYILLTTDEEKGGIGASIVSKTLPAPLINYMIELDRRGSNDAIFYECGNKEFQDYILSYGFEKKYGSYTDICDLSPAWDLASVNLSIGYENEHTKSEIINVNHMNNTIEKVKSMLLAGHRVKYDYQEEKWTYNYSNYQDYNLNWKGSRTYDYCEICGKTFSDSKELLLIDDMDVCKECLEEHWLCDLLGEEEREMEVDFNDEPTKSIAT